MANQPDTLEHLLDQYLFRMCTKYGYCISKVDREKLKADASWSNEEEFVSLLMRADGLEPSDQPKHFKLMIKELKVMISNFEVST